MSDVAAAHNGKIFFRRYMVRISDQNVRLQRESQQLNRAFVNLYRGIKLANLSLLTWVDSGTTEVFTLMDVIFIELGS